MSEKTIIAVDLGAESGRVLKFHFNGERMREEDVHRFPNVPVQVGDTLHWDVLRLWHEIKTGIDMALDGSASIGIDTWGVDYALLDRDGNLISNPTHYRDTHTHGMMEWVFERVPRRQVYERTGIQFMVINTLYQLAALAQVDSPVLYNAATYLPIPDLFNYWLSGEKTAEFTHVSTMQLFNPRKNDWDRETLTTLNIPTEIFPDVIRPGHTKGEYNGIPVIAPGTHDTASAVVAVPTTTTDYVYISSGTWSLLGMEVDDPVINDTAYELNLTNEGGVDNNYRLLKNNMGLWLVQQCRSAWRDAGQEYDYGTLTDMAVDAEPFHSFVDPDDQLFLPVGDMPSRIRDFCQNTNQTAPEAIGQTARIIYESLALKYRYNVDKLRTLTGRTVEAIHIIGGGSQNELLCQMTADATNRPVVAGPVEATAMGNAIVQLIALGEIGSISEAREMLRRSVGTKQYEPQHVDAWEGAYERFKEIITTD